MGLKETYNKIAHDWHKEVLSHLWWEDGVNKFISLLKRDETILDVGCGPGITSKIFVEHGLKVTGIDFSEKMIEIAKEKVPKGNFLVMDLDEVGNLETVFDAIFMKAVLLHVPKKQAQEKLKNIIKLLKKDGYLYLSVKQKRVGGFNEEVRVDDDYGYKVERFFSYFTEREIKSYFESLDFKIVFFEIIPFNDTMWIQVIAKKL